MQQLSFITTEQTSEQQWEAVRSRDTRFDGLFFFAVTTTGVYCRPGCKSRTPLREHVRFFASTVEAEAAGFRPCKRCAPRAAAAPDDGAQAVRQACELMDQAETRPTLAELGEAVGLSPFHFQRLFKKTLGITPLQYFQARRSARVREKLAEHASVTGAIFAAGYGSNSRFYSQSADILGMTPGDYRKGGAGMDIQYATAQSALGWVLVAATDRGICAIELGDSPEELEAGLRERFPAARHSQADARFAEWVSSVIELIEAPSGGLNLPLDIRGTAFQQQVWAALRTIPAGTTVSYAELAEKIGRPNAVRAVAHACASNQIAVAIPCHRVLRASGELGGYRWGLERKRRLLLLEKEG